jgi:type VI secretion system protein ImpJ
VRFDLAALQAGQLALTHLRAVLPDGAAIDLDDTSPQRPATRPIAPHFPASLARVRVHLSAAALRPGASNSAREPGAQHRYRTVTRAIFDLTLARSARDIDLDELHLALKPRRRAPRRPGLPPPRRARPRQQRRLRPRRHLHPTDRRRSPLPALRAELQTLCALVATRRRALADDRRRQHELPRALFFHSLSGALPLLRHLADAPECAPHPLYRDLLRLLGELRSFTTGELPDPPPYDFSDLRAASPPSSPSSASAPSTPSPTAASGSPSSPAPTACGSVSSATIACSAAPPSCSPSRPTPTRASSPASSRPSPASPPGDGSTSSSANNILGAPIRHTAHPPVELPVLPQHSYFTVSADDPSWLEVLRERNVAVYLPRPYDPDHARISLLAIPALDA